MTPLNERRWRNFKANRRGFWSLRIFLVLFFVTLFAPLIANDKPLILTFEGSLYFPAFNTYAETTFGGDFATEADYRDPFVQDLIADADGIMIWPLIRYSYDTINRNLPVPAPAPPSAENWLGTDDQGRDVVARLIYGFRISVLFGLTLTFFSSIIGVAAGAVQGYFGGWLDLIFQRFIEIWTSVPQLYLLIIIAAIIEPNFWILLCILLLFSWVALVGVVRAEFLRGRNFEYVNAARALGVSNGTIIYKHLLPNAMVATLTFMPFILNASITTLTSLDFLGFGLPPGSPSLGELLAQGKANLQAPWLGFSGFFTIAIMLSLLIFIGEAGEEVTHAVKGVSLTIDAGETVALVGESGSGKSVTALSILKLLPYPQASHPHGSIRYRGDNLMSTDEDALRSVRGNQISMVFQEPMTSLNPLHTIERQVGEILIRHRGLSNEAARAEVLSLLKKVGIRDAESRLGAYPHQLSGGQRQRVMIAMALANEPDLLIADEPTTALDVTVQAQILALLKELQREMGMAMLLITHDLGIVRKMADRTYVMTGGEVVETGPTAQIFSEPQHDYTKHLLAAEPKGHPEAPRVDAPVVMETDDLKVWFPIKKGLLRKTVDHVKAVDGISVRVQEGQTVGIVGESGSGKTTLGLALLRLISSEGPIRFEGDQIDGLTEKDVRPLREHMQIVFQDPFGSLSPRLSISQIVEEGLIVQNQGLSATERRTRVSAALQEVGIDPAMQDRYPHEFSGGQRQRIAIARAMALQPKFVMLDEPTSALDMSVQAQIVDLLRSLQKKYNLAYLFISHDLKVVRALADQVIVMRAGKVVEQGPADQIFDAPQTDYTKTLMAAAFDLETGPGVASS
eukprot:s1_g1043.t1